MFHIFEYLEEDNFLLIREGEGKIGDERLDQLSIQRSCGCESFGGLDGFLFFLDTDHLESEQFLIPES